jgi:transcriptional regulator with XRE-family HTH domain
MVALGFGVRELAELANVSPDTVARLERGEELRERTIDALRRALELAGVEFIAENGCGPGVRLKRTAKGVEEISQEIDALEDKISSMPAPTEPSPEAGMNVMRKAVAKNDLAKLKGGRFATESPGRHGGLVGEQSPRRSLDNRPRRCTRRSKSARHSRDNFTARKPSFTIGR